MEKEWLAKLGLVALSIGPIIGYIGYRILSIEYYSNYFYKPYETEGAIVLVIGGGIALLGLLMIYKGNPQALSDMVDGISGESNPIQPGYKVCEKCNNGFQADYEFCPFCGAK